MLTNTLKVNDIKQYDTANSLIDEINKSNSPNKRYLHILLVTETWLPDVNGVAMSLHQIMSELVQMGHQVSLLRPKPIESQSNSKDFTNNEIDDGSHILTHQIHVKGFKIPKYPDLQFGFPAYKTISKQLKKLQPDIVHIATEGPLGLAALMAAKKQNIPATTGYHTQFHDFSHHFGFGVIAQPLMSYLKWFHNASNATCVPSKKTENDLQQLGFERLYQVGRGIDVKRFNPQHRSEKLRQKWGANEQDTVLLMVSRVSPEKGVQLVIDSFRALLKAQPNRGLKLVIVGDGPDKNRLQSLCADIDDKIIFAGLKTGENLSQHYASADVFVFGSQVETFGNVVTEAMASGLPVYAFDDAAAGMLVVSKGNEQCGNLVKLADSQGFINMIENLPSLSKLKQQGENAVSQVSGFSWQHSAEQMQKMFLNSVI